MFLRYCNHTSRYDLAADAVRLGALQSAKVAVSAHRTESYIKHLAIKDKEYIYANGKGASMLLLTIPGISLTGGD